MSPSEYISLSEPEAECSDCSPYASPASSGDSVDTGTSEHYRAWCLQCKRKPPKTSTSSMSSIVPQQNWTEWWRTSWYWCKFAGFLLVPFVARQVGIYLSRRWLHSISGKMNS